MRNRFCLGLLTWIIILIISPITPINAVGPGTVSGTVGQNGDTYWTGTWSTVYIHNDVNTTQWTTGLTFSNLSYRNGAGAYHFYVKEVTIPWIEITYVGDNNHYIYPHDDTGGSMNGKLMFNGPFQGGQFSGYTESNNQPNQPTILTADYDLDVNGDGNRDFQFEETIELHGNGLANKGYVDVGMKILSAPVGWIIGQGQNAMRVDRIRYAFLMDPDVYSNSSNDFYLYDDFNQVWIKQNNECQGNADMCDGIGRCAKLVNQAQNQQIAAIAKADSHSWAHWHGLQYHGNEYSRQPEEYENSESLAGTDGLFWCDEEYDVANRNYPPGIGVAPAGFIFSDFA